MLSNDAQAQASSSDVDVVIPCYQYGRFLRECVTSVLSQGIKDVRILIIDNASTDNSVEVAKQLALEDRRVEVIARNHNLGPHASFNEGIDWATSKYFIVLCADDLLAPGGLAHAIAVMEQHPEVVFAYGRAALLRPQDSSMQVIESDPRQTPWRIVAGHDIIERFCRDGTSHIGGPSTVLVRTAAQKLAGYYRPELPHSDDFEMWMRLARLGPAARTEAHLAILRFHESSRSAGACRVGTCDRWPAWPWHDDAAFESFFAHEGALLPDAARLHQVAKRSVADRAYWSALAHLCRGETNAAPDLLKFAFARRPRTVIFPPLRYLFRRADTTKRIVSVVTETVHRRRASDRPARADA